MDDVKYEYGCEVTSTKECPLREEIRVDTIDECIKFIKNSIPSEEAFTKCLLVKGLEQLKEQNK